MPRGPPPAEVKPLQRLSMLPSHMKSRPPRAVDDQQRAVPLPPLRAVIVGLCVCRSHPVDLKENVPVPVARIEDRLSVSRWTPQSCALHHGNPVQSMSAGRSMNENQIGLSSYWKVIDVDATSMLAKSSILDRATAM